MVAKDRSRTTGQNGRSRKIFKLFESTQRKTVKLGRRESRDLAQNEREKVPEPTKEGIPLSGEKERNNYEFQQVHEVALITKMQIFK